METQVNNFCALSTLGNYLKIDSKIRDFFNLKALECIKNSWKCNEIIVKKVILYHKLSGLEDIQIHTLDNLAGLFDVIARENAVADGIYFHAKIFFDDQEDHITINFPDENNISITDNHGKNIMLSNHPNNIIDYVYGTFASEYKSIWRIIVIDSRTLKERVYYDHLYGNIWKLNECWKCHRFVKKDVNCTSKAKCDENEYNQLIKNIKNSEKYKEYSEKYKDIYGVDEPTKINLVDKLENCRRTLNKTDCLINLEKSHNL